MHGIPVELTPDLQEALQRKFATLLRHDPSITRLNIRLHKNQSGGTRHPYRATVQVERTGVDMVAGSEGTDAYGTLNDLSQKLDEQLGRRNGRTKEWRIDPHPSHLAADRPNVGETSQHPSRSDNGGTT